LKVTLASSSEVSIPVLNFLLNSPEVELISVITNPDKATGRGQEVTSNRVAKWSQDLQVSVEKPKDGAELLAYIKKINPDLLITVAYGHILKEEILNHPKFGVINLHYSLLPAYRGAAPVQWAILNGEKLTGVSVFKLDAGMDTGPIYLQKEQVIAPDDSTVDLITKLNDLGVKSIGETLRMIKDGISPTAQSNLGSSYAPKFSKSDGAVNWSKSTAEIYNLFRALADNPGIYTTYSGIKIRLNRMSIVDFEAKSLKPGQFFHEAGNLIVGTGNGSVQISSLTPEGRKVMSGTDFYNGLQDKKVDRFG
jgi:methionyl-tRNA formyltransferase